MKRLASLVLALVLSLGLCVPALASEFSDVPASHPFHDAIIWAAGRGIVGGYDDGTFKPANTVTRAQFCAMLSRAFYPQDVTSNSRYASQGAFMPNYMALFNNGILEGTWFSTITALQKTDFMNRGIERCQMAQLMTNILTQKGFAASDAEKNAAITKISDYDNIPSYLKDAVANVYALGIITGYADGSFGDSNTMNRGQAAVVIYRLAQYVGDGSGTGPAVSADDELTDVPNSPGGTPAGQNASAGAENGRLTLRDGSAVTEENARKILEVVMAKYPGENWTADSRRDPDVTFNGNSLGGISETLYELQYTYDISMSAACGGLAAMASDAIFGGGGTGGENFPARKLDTVTDARVGDIYINLDKNGHSTHVSVITSVGETMTVTDSRKVVQRITKYDGGGNGGSTDTSTSIFDGTKNGYTIEVWTRYPE